MTAVPVPAAVPPALGYMLNPGVKYHGIIRGETLLQKLHLCSRGREDCEACLFKCVCIELFDYLVDQEKITWKGVDRYARLTRFN